MLHLLSLLPHLGKVGLTIDPRSISGKVAKIDGVDWWRCGFVDTASRCCRCRCLSLSLLVPRIGVLHKLHERVAGNEVGIKVVGNIHTGVAEQLDNAEALLRSECDRCGLALSWLSRLLGRLSLLCRLMRLLLHTRLLKLSLSLKLAQLELLYGLDIRLVRKLLQRRRRHLIRLRREPSLLILLGGLEALAVRSTDVL